MSKQNGHLVLHDLADLARIFTPQTPAPCADAPPRPAPDAACAAVAAPADEPPLIGAPDLPQVTPDRRPGVTDVVAGLAAQVEAALAELAAVTESELHDRQQAEAALVTVQALDAAAERLAGIIGAAEDAGRQAATLAATALTGAGRERAGRMATVTAALVATARSRRTVAQDQAAALAAQPEVVRLLAEQARVAAEADAHARTAREQQALDAGIARVEALLAEGNENEARRRLGALTKDHPNRPELASLTVRLALRAQAVKSVAADRALRTARRLARHTPAEAVALLGPLDLDGVPDDLARQVYGCWLAAGRRVAPAGARHYSPRFGQGAVVVPTGNGEVEVVTAIGLPEWTAGRRVAAAALRGLRPL